MTDAAANLVYTKSWLEKTEAELLAELDKLMVKCGLEDAAAVCIGWQPKFADLPPRFADEDCKRPVIAFKVVDTGKFGWVQMCAELLCPFIDGDSLVAENIATLSRKARELEVVARWQRADADYERALRAAKDCLAAQDEEA